MAKTATATKDGPDVASTAPAPKLPAPIAVPNLLAAIVEASKDPTCQPEKMHALLDVRNRLMREQAEVQYRQAYRAAKKKMPRITKDGKIDEGITRSGRAGKKTRFATYENLNEVISPILEEVGLDLSLHPEPSPTGVGIMMRATLSYIGQTDYGEIVYAESGVIPMPPDATGSKNPAQAISSALAYAKRNAVVLVLNLVSYAPEDRDLDGNAPHTSKPKAVAAKPDLRDEPAADDNPKISTDQLATLAKAIADCGVGVAKFNKFYEIDKPTDLPAARYQEALDACARYKANNPPRKKS